MSLDAENVTLPTSGLVFHNSYGAGVTEAYRAAIVSAETELQSHFSNSLTVEMHFDLQPLGPGWTAQNTYQQVAVSYDGFRAALAAHATSASDLQAVAGLPQDDPSHGAGFWMPTAQARALGLSADAVAVDDAVVLNSDLPQDFGPDAVSTLEHEITEGVFGRVSSLGIGLPAWQPMDLFRFSADGARDYSGGADGQTAFFGVDGAHLSTLEFHNGVSPSGASDGGDLADWTSSADVFGPGGPGIVGALSAADLQALDILGWTPAASAAAGASVVPADSAADPHGAAQMDHVMTNLWGGWVDL